MGNNSNRELKNYIRAGTKGLVAFILSDHYQSRFERIPSSSAALANLEDYHQESHIYQGRLQGSSSGVAARAASNKMEPRRLRTFRRSCWSQSASGRLEEIAAVESYLGAEVPLGLPASCDQRPRSVISGVFENLEALSTEMHPIQQVKHLSWLGLTTA